MSLSTAEAEAQEAVMEEERLATVFIDGDRHHLIWVHDRDRFGGLLLDRPEEGHDTRDRLLGSFGPAEDTRAVEALIADFEESYVKRPRAERIRPRPLLAADLEALQLGREP